MRYFLIILSIVFMLFAAVQFNDPDPILWVIIYLIPAVTSIYLIKWRLNQAVLLILCLIYFIGAILIFPPSFSEWIKSEEEAKSLGMMLPGIEEGREAAGLFLCSLSFLGYFLYQRKRNQQFPS